jgi:branched-chain amino acid transport system ATP-binding protein
VSTLRLSRVGKRFGGLRAVSDVSFEVAPKSIFGLIGPNGAGKTTVFNLVTGVYDFEGTIHFGDRSLAGMKPAAIAAAGIARTFQNIRLFPEMTVLENVMIGRDCRLKSGVVGAIVRNKATNDEEEKVVLDSFRVLEIVGIGKWANETAKNLPYGAQRRLEIARALATEPFLLLLDEPAAGMNPQETRDLVGLIRRLRSEHNLSIFLIEHDMSLVMTLSERIYVMDYGKLIAMGDPAEVRKNPAVIKAYLGEDVSA